MRRLLLACRLLLAAVPVLPLAAVPVLLLAAVPADAARIVSLNLCADDFLVLLAPEQVAAVSILARDPSLSVVAPQAARLKTVRADAEAVLALHPDMVLAGAFGAQTTLALLAQRGIRIERIGAPHDFDSIRAETLRLAALLGEPARGDALLAAMDRKLAAVSSRAPARTPSHALAVQPRGYTSGPGSLTDAVLRAAGLIDIGAGRQVSIETLAARPPDVLVQAQSPAFPSLATDWLRHPALAAIPRRTVPPSLLICGGPWTADAVALLAE